jgi:hypothetical protein
MRSRPTFHEHSFRAEESVSPIRQMETEEKTSYQERHGEKVCDGKIERLTNVLKAKENKITHKGQRNETHKSANSSKRFSGVEMGSTNRAVGDLENKLTNFSVTNIDRIQQRIQSVLTKK